MPAEGGGGGGQLNRQAQMVLRHDTSYVWALLERFEACGGQQVSCIGAGLGLDEACLIMARSGRGGGGGGVISTATIRWSTGMPLHTFGHFLSTLKAC